MHRKPNAFQRFLHRFLMLRPVSALLARVLHHADNFALRLSRSRWTFAGLVGLPIIQLTTVGAISGQPRTVPLVGLVDGEKIALIGSNFGGANHPGWVYNLKANPECIVKQNGQMGTYIAREADEGENKYYYNMAISYYVGFAAYKQRAKNRKITVMVLEPKNSSTNSR